MLAHWNLSEVFHERAARRRAAGQENLAQADIAAARALLDAQRWRIPTESGITTADSLGAFGCAAFYSVLGRHLLVTGDAREARRAFECELDAAQRQPFVDSWSLADSYLGLGQAEIALDDPHTALSHASRALELLADNDDSDTRAMALLVRAQALRCIGDSASAYDALADHYALRTQLETAAAQQYAAHMTAKLGVERARAEAESERRMARTLETFGAIGREMTATLDAQAVCAIFARHATEILAATAFGALLLDANGDRLHVAFATDDAAGALVSNGAIADPSSPLMRALRERTEVFDLAPPAPLQTALYSPLVVADRVLGVVALGSTHQPYTDSESSAVHAISTYAAIALDNAAAYAKLEAAVVALQATQAELERLSMTDALTGVANRRCLGECAQAAIAALRRHGGELAVVMFDIDHFKRVNDTYGHAAGDAVLQQLTRTAKERLRSTDLLARMGGEEFALLLPEAGIDVAVRLAERIRSSIAAMNVAYRGANIGVTSSFGVAAFDAATDTFDRALSRADAALYRAKQAGRDRVCAA